MMEEEHSNSTRMDYKRYNYSARLPKKESYTQDLAASPQTARGERRGPPCHTQRAR